jgi:hypothetical protein
MMLTDLSSVTISFAKFLVAVVSTLASGDAAPKD